MSERDYPEGQDEPRPQSGESFLEPDDPTSGPDAPESDGPPPGGAPGGLGVPPAAD